MTYLYYYYYYVTFKFVLALFWYRTHSKLYESLKNVICMHCMDMSLNNVKLIETHY